MTLKLRVFYLNTLVSSVVYICVPDNSHKIDLRGHDSPSPFFFSFPGCGIHSSLDSPEYSVRWAGETLQQFLQQSRLPGPDVWPEVALPWFFLPSVL